MEIIKECARLLDAVRASNPLVHHLTNNVTVNDCANVSLAVGASPIMANAIEEAAEAAAMASAVVLNIGTLNAFTLESMLAAGTSANAAGRPVVFDPVGAGATAFRGAAAARILDKVRVAAIRGNVSEIRAVGGLSSHTKGVDADDADMKTDAGRLVFELAGRMGCVVAATGRLDAVSDGVRAVLVENGNSALSRVSGTGCMCTSLTGAFLGAAPDAPFAGAVAALLCMGIAGEIAFERAGSRGTASYRAAIIDAISLMDGNMLLKRGRVHEAAY